MLDHRGPDRVELPGRSGSASPGDAVRLLDECDADPFRARDLRHRYQIPRRHPSGGSMTENQRGPRLIGGVQVGVRAAMGRVHLELPHTVDAGRRALRSLQARRSELVSE